MADEFLLPILPPFPPPPAGLPPGFDRWFQELIRIQYRILADRLEALSMVGVIASRPAADGSFRFYFSTDESPKKLYFDDGTWNAV